MKQIVFGNQCCRTFTIKCDLQQQHKQYKNIYIQYHKIHITAPSKRKASTGRASSYHFKEYK